MTEYRDYLIRINYSCRTDEKQFIKNILRNFDNNTLTGAYIVVNNNVYDLECYIYLHFERKHETFEKWMKDKYPEKTLLFTNNETVFGEFILKGYNFAGFIGDDTVDMIITSEVNSIFLFPEQKILKEIWKKANINIVDLDDTISNEFRVFLSHSSNDKSIVDEVYLGLKEEGINPWFDKYEIYPGESITSKINEGLQQCHLGLIFLSNNFINSKNSWTINEMNYFFQSRMNQSNIVNFICLNIDLKHEDIPPLFQDYLYINYSDKNYKQKLINSIKRIYKMTKN